MLKKTLALGALLSLSCGSNEETAKSGTNDGNAGAGFVVEEPGTGHWINRTPRPIPTEWAPIGAQIPLAYDGARQRVLMFGGGTSSGWLMSHELYEWDGDAGQWHDLAPTPLPAAWPQDRAGQAIAWDERRHKLVVFGGTTTEQTVISYPRADLWELDSDTLTWQDRTPAVLPAEWPAKRFLHAMAYDSARDKVVLFGGWGEQFVVYGDLWEWDGNTGTWTNRTPSPLPSAWPKPRYEQSMIYDAARGRTVLFGGYIEGPMTNEIWEWDGNVFVDRTPNPLPASWPEARDQNAVAFDPSRGVLLVFGGYAPIMGDTWEWQAATNQWTLGPPVGPSPRRGATMAFDVRRKRAVLFGGQNVELAPPLRDTWEYDVTADTPAKTPVHQTIDQACTEAPTSIDPGALALTDAIPTATGTPKVRSYHLDRGTWTPQDSFVEVILDLGNCELTFVHQKTDPKNTLVLASQGQGNGCDYEGLGTGLAGSLAYSGLMCSTQSPNHTDCFSGVFELRLTSHTVAGSAPVLTGAPFHLAGGVCAIAR